MRTSRTAATPVHFEPIEPRLLLDSAPIGIATADDLTAVTVVRDSTLDLFTQEADDGQWTRRNVGSFIPEDFIPTSAASFLDPGDERVYHAVNAPRGLAILPDPAEEDSVGPDDFRILTDEIPGSQPIASNVTTFTSADGRVHIAGLNAAGEVVLFAQTGERNDNGADWAFANISRDVLAPQGAVTPVFQGDLSSFATPWNSLNIVGLDSSGQIQNVWFAPSPTGGSWNVSNLSEAAGTPALSGDITTYLTAWDGINVAGIDPTGNLIVTWWVPSFGADWAATNLTESFGGPALSPGTVLAYTTPWGGLNVGGVTAANAVGGPGNLALWWWVPEFGDQWQIAPDVVPGVETLSAAVDQNVSSFTSPAGTVNVLGLAATDRDVVRLSWRPDDGVWRAEDLDDIAEADPTTPGPTDPNLAALAGSWQVSGSGGVFEEFDVDEDATVELRSDGVWTIDDGDLDLSIFGSDTDQGTWTYSGGVLTITIPDTGTTTATGVPANATSFTTTGVTLTASGRTRLEDRIDDIDDIPFVDVRDEINDRGGLDAVLADVDLQWTRL